MAADWPQVADVDEQRSSTYFDRDRGEQGFRAGRVREEAAMVEMEDEVASEEELDEQEVADPLADRYVCLRLEQVEVYETKNVRRRPYSLAEIEERAAQLERQPLLHPPAVFERHEGKFELVTGYGRFLALRHLKREEAVFRLVDEPDRRTRLLLMGAENLVRKEMSGAERVEYVWRLVEQERMTAAEVGGHLNLSERYVRSLVGIRRDACPELFVAFQEEEIPIRRMLGLINHPFEEQMKRLRDGDRWARRAQSVDQGYVDHTSYPDHPTDPFGFLHFEEMEEDEGFLDAYHQQRLPSFAPRTTTKGKPLRERRRAPSVREQRQMLEALDEVRDADPRLIEGMRRAFRWSVYGEDIPELPATAMRRARRNARRRERRAEERMSAAESSPARVEAPLDALTDSPMVGELPPPSGSPGDRLKLGEALPGDE